MLWTCGDKDFNDSLYILDSLLGRHVQPLNPGWDYHLKISRFTNFNWLVSTNRYVFIIYDNIKE